MLHTSISRFIPYAFLAVASAARADVVISELMYHPLSENPLQEYIELHNPGAATVSVAGWQFTNGITFTIPAATTIPAGGYLVVAANAAAFSAKYPTVTNYVAGWTGQLSNSSNTITLKDAALVTRDSVKYADDGDWATRREDEPADLSYRGWHWFSAADGGGKSLELIQLAADNSRGQNWGDSTTLEGTPGAANSIAAANIAPLISEVEHYPLVPTSSDAVTVNVKLADELTTGVTATLYWRLDGGSFAPLPMFDDGAHSDGLAGDGRYGAQISAQANGAIVEFYVEASDAAANVRTWPKAALDWSSGTSSYTAAQVTNCLYQVENTVYAGAAPIYRMVARAADLATLQTINNAASQSGVKFNATFITRDGTSTELRYQCGVGNRGHFSAGLDPQNFKVAIPSDWDWKGRVALNLNGQYPYVQLLGSSFMRRVGIATPESRAVQVRINGADLSTTPPRGNGFYVCNEAYNSDFAERHYPQDSGGNIYSVRRTDFGPYEEGFFDYRTPAGLNGADPYRTTYFKETNVSEDNWSDLIALSLAVAKGQSTTLAATPTWDADYVTAIQAKLDVTQWMRWFAAEILMNNDETNLSRGYGDDFYLYIGETDARARLIPHDLDSVFGLNDGAVTPSNTSIFRPVAYESPTFAANTPSPLYPFFRHPDFAQVYFQQMRDLLDGEASVANFNQLCDQTLNGVVSAGDIATRKAWHLARHTYVSGLIGQPLAVTVAPAIVSGYPQVLVNSVNVGGTANPMKTRRVRVNGVLANYTPWSITGTNVASAAIGRWSITGVVLTPGINRLHVTAFDAANVEFENLYFDVWYNDGGTQTITGPITTNVTWTAAGGPYVLSADLAVNSGGTVNIEAGTSIFLGTGVDIIVATGGRILAEGTDANPIRFLRAPGSAVTWPGIDVNGAVGSSMSVFRHCTFEHSSSYAIDVNAGNVEIDYCYFAPTCVDYLSLDGASFLISNCVFPTGNTAGETTHGAGGIRSDGRGIVRNCFFGYSNGYNDVFDFTGGNRPGPNLQFINNVCVGGDDDILDLDGTDAWVEGNLFMNVHRIGTPDSASAVSGGSNGSDISHVTVVGNLFYNVDQACTGKQGNFYTFLNNTVVDQSGRGSDEMLENIVGEPEVFLPAVYNLADEGIPSGAGMYGEGNIIHSATKLMRNYTGTQTVTWNNNIFPAGITWAGPGSGNTNIDPQLADIIVNLTTGASNIPTPTAANFLYLTPKIRAQFMLKPSSTAIGTGPNGTNKGGVRAHGVSISGIPSGTTNATTATAIVGSLWTGNGIPAGAAQFPNGSGWTHYKSRLDGGAWSAETPIATSIALSGLANGVHTLEVVGKNDVAYYQDDIAFGTSATITSKTWTVDTAYVPPAPAAIVRISEVLASNTETINFGTVFPDIIELTNVGNATADLTGWGLTDNAALPYKYPIANGTTLAPGAHLTIYASNSASVPAPKTGFSLKQSGDDLTLTRSVAQGGGIVDIVAWGQQLSDFSIARGSDGSWTLGKPTFGAANQFIGLGDRNGVVINEWLTDAVTLFANDFIELHNPSTLPVDVGGCYLTDNPSEFANQHLIQPLTFISNAGYISFKADGDIAQGADHVNFKLSPLQGEIGYMSPTLETIDLILYGPQSTDVSQGRTPNGALTTALFTQPTPAAPNTTVATSTSTQTTVLMGPLKTWAYWANPTTGPALDGASLPYTNPAYNDSTWVAAAGQILHQEPDALNWGFGFAKTTQLPNHGGTQLRPYQTYYFRTHFTYSGAASGVTFNARIACDDGCVITVNGTELPRIRVAGGAVTFATQATNVTDGTVNAITIPANLIVSGDNVIAVSVHQSATQTTTTGSSDIVWGMQLDAVASVTTSSNPIVLNEVLPINVSFQNPDSSYAGWIELYNASASPVDLADYSLTDAVGTPRKFIFPAATTIPANGYLTLTCNALTAASATNTGFGLNGAGDQVYLYNKLANGGGLVDSVNFGQQLPDLSIARIPDATGAFALGVPTRTALNTAAATTTATNVKLNEWLSSGTPTWLELYNTAAQPVLLSGNYLTDSFGNKTKHLIPPLTYLGGTGNSRWLQLIADNDTSATINHVNFTIEPGEGLWLFAGNGTQLDGVAVTAQATNISQGRFADGSATIIALTPTPGAANQRPDADTDGDGMPDAYELANGLNPNSAADATLDADGDGQTNKAEYLAGTNPQLPGSKLTATVTATATPGQFAITFTAIAGKAYTVRYKDDLNAATWTTLQQIPSPGTDTLTVINDTPSVPKRYYQIVTPQQ